MEDTNQEKTENDSEKPDSKESERLEFKKPVLIGRVGKLPKNIKKQANRPPEAKQPESSNKEPAEDVKTESPSTAKSNLPPAVLLKELSTPIPYKEPKWSGLCPDGSQYGLEVLKSGMILENIELTNKPYYVFGRLANCDVVMAHPTISRHHCVLQYKAFAEADEPPSGWYLYDLGSTHGTYLNKEKLKPSHYTRVRVGHQIKLGASTRTYIVQGPDYDCEGESDLTVTELKRRALEMKLDRDRMIQEAAQEERRRKEEEERKREEQGIDWGMGEDADEEVDLSENPYAIPHEELEISDPKKTLRGYFEREGHELTYHCDERAPGQFLCRVELPIDDPHGRPVVAEVLHRGKKKEAVIACALEACRILERFGALRQATHESKRRAARDWAADDYYDSDEDPFLDRTGALEVKRKHRMRKHGKGEGEGKETGKGKGNREENKALTYDDLCKQVADIESKISFEEKNLERLRASGGKKRSEGEAGEEDELDAYMEALKHQGMSMATKAHISQTKMSISTLKKELSRCQRLAELARPAHLPPLIKQHSKMAVKKTDNDILYGKRIRLKEDTIRQKKPRKETKQEETEFVEEVDSDEDMDSTHAHNTHTNTEHHEQTKSTRDSTKIDEECSKLEKDSATSGSSTSEKDTVKPNSEKESSTSEKDSTISASSKSERENSTNEKDNTISASSKSEQDDKPKRMFGPMRPPENYVIPENYFDQESDRDLPNIEEA